MLGYSGGIKTVLYSIPSKNAPNTYLNLRCRGSQIDIIFSNDKDIDAEYPVTTYVAYEEVKETWTTSTDGDHKMMFAPNPQKLLARMVKDQHSIRITYLPWNEHVAANRATFDLTELPITSCQ